MKQIDFMLEMADGTVVRVGSLNESRHPDVKAFLFPPGALMPFSQNNLPTARCNERRDTPYLMPSF